MGRTPLQLAAEAGHLEICQLIIDSVEDKNPGNPIYSTPLAAAVSIGHLQICKLIMNNIEEPEVSDKEYLVRMGIRYNQLEVCEFLIDRETDGNSYHKPIYHIFFFSLLTIMFPEEFVFHNSFKWAFFGSVFVPLLLALVYFSPLFYLFAVVVAYRRSSEYFASNQLFDWVCFLCLYLCQAKLGYHVLFPRLQSFIKRMKGLQI